MEASEIIVGLPYIVSATGTNSGERWTVKKVNRTLNGVEIEAVGSKTAYMRTFRPENFVSLDRKTAKKMITETVEKIGEVNGADMNIENVIYMPFHERRGRKPKVAA